MSSLKRLITNKDNFDVCGVSFLHIHKSLGLTSLLLFSVQLLNMYTLVPGDPLSLLYISPHFMLALSAKIFHVPVKRTANKSTIHEEYRLHTIIFSFRSIFIFFLHWLNITNWFCYFFGTFIWHIIADRVTKIYYDENSGTTIRGRTDYDGYENIHPMIISTMRYFASFSQYTIIYYLAMPHLNMETFKIRYISLIAIQLTAFIKTLILKRFLPSYYSGVLYAIILIISLSYANYNFNFIMSGVFFSIMRFHYNFNKYLLWSFIVGSNYYLATYYKLMPS